MRRKSWAWKDVELPGNHLEQIHRRFERDFFEGVIRSEPENVEALIALGEVYSRTGLLNEGLEIDKKLVEMAPEEPKFHYNLACTHSLLGHIDPALSALSHAIELGYNKIEQILADPDLDNLKKDRRYQEILRQFNAATPKKKLQD